MNAINCIEQTMITDTHACLIEQLNEALSAARMGDWVREEEIAERIRDMSYELQPRYAGYQLRSACGALDAVQRSPDLEGGFAFVEHEIDKLRDMFERTSSQDAA